MKNKGFTLVELIGVLVIMGMLLLIVLPATSGLMRDNEKRKYSNYYDVVVAAVEKYARTQRDSLGGISGEGCKDSDTLSSLIERGIVNKYEDENITCKTPNEFGEDALTSYGIDATRDYDNIRMENKNGIIKTSLSMICFKEGKEKPVYINLTEKNTSCNIYVPEVVNSLIKRISDNGAIEYYLPGENATDGNTYVTGNPLNNYVWYSGKMWRIVSYNTNDKTMKLVTDDVISIVTYHDELNNYGESNIYTWLNVNFFRTLKNPDKYIKKAEWNYTESANPEVIPAKTNLKQAYIGMLNNYEYNKGKNYLGISKNFWLLSINGTNQASYVDSSNSISSSNVATFYGVRPSITLIANIAYSSGNGTRSNPYRLIGDVSANGGTLLNSRYSGEYVNFYGTNYRIMETSSEYTVLVAIDPVSDPADIGFHDYDNVYSRNTYIGEYLDQTWKTPIADKLKTRSFCRMLIATTTSQTTGCVDPDHNVINEPVAIPKIGDMFTADSSREYWTLTNASGDKIYVVNTDCTLTPVAITHTSAIRPVIVVKNDVRINSVDSGKGTPDSPYVIG